MKYYSLQCILFLLVLGSCNSSLSDGKSGSKDSSTVNLNDKRKDSLELFQFMGDSIQLAPFTIRVELSEQAKQRIVKGKETIKINVSVTGDTKDSTLWSDDGEFYLSTSEKEIEYGQPAVFANIRFPKKYWEKLSEKLVFINAFAFSGRKSSPNNLLDCTIIADTASKIVNQEWIITGKLIGEK